jgi:hypothetical protein
MTVREPVLRPSLRAGPAYWIFIPALLLSGLLLWTSTHGRPDAFFVGLALASLLPPLCGICLRAMRLKTGASICAVIVLGWYWLPTLLLFFVVIMGGRRAGGLVLVVYSVEFIIPMGIFALAATISFGRGAGAGWAASAFMTAFFCSVVLAGAAQNHQRSKQMVPSAADPTALGADLLTLHRCNQDFSRAYPAIGFADSLDQLGPQGTRCLSPGLVSGVTKEFTIRYKPGLRGTDGRVNAYSVSGWETAPKAVDHTTIYADESGMIWYRLEGPKGPTKGWLESFYPGSNFAAVLRCVEEPDPSRVRIYRGNELLKFTDRDDFIRNCLASASFSSAKTFSLDKYEYRYTFSSSKIEVSARPASYGVGGLRSFLAVSSLGENGSVRTRNVYATPQNRAATTDDPLAMAQEVGLPLSTGVAREVYCGNQLCP